MLDFAGNYTEFHDWKLNSTPAISAAVSKNGNAGRSQSSESSTTSTLSKNQRNELEKRIRVIETEIPALELEASKLTSTIALPKVAADYGKLAEATEKLTTIEARIQALGDEWSVAADQLR
ncbi:MAG: hypothetical protein IPP63_14150 [Chloracidobacterium sp.]|nr:hypothetical protein [Chloracidobacterium sp.]